MRTRLSRDLHPVAWWLWATGLAAAASQTTNPLVLLLLVTTAAVTVAARRGDQPWARSFRLYLWLGVLIVVVRVVFRIIVGSDYPGSVVLDLPGIPLPDWVLGLTLLGPVTLQSLLAGLYDGLRLATIVICVGAANALANPKRLLRSVPPALYEIGTALVVAVTVLPQLADSARRVRAAQALRAAPARAGRVRGLRRVLVPVLEDALERSLALAAGMDTRGYGRSGTATRGQRRTTGALMLLGLLGVCAGTYAALDQTHALSALLTRVLLGGGLAVAGIGLVSAGRRVERTRYRADRWRLPELVVAASGLGVAYAGIVLAESDVAVAYPALDAMPTLTLVALAGPLLGLVAAVAAPPPVLGGALRAPAARLRPVPVGP